jgi:hypothetical protein
MPNIMKLRDLAKEIVNSMDEDGYTEETERLFTELETKGAAAVAPLCDVIDELALRGEARKSKAKELAELAAKDEAMIANAKKYLMAIMRTLGQDKMVIGGLSVTLAKGRESIEVTDEALIPDSYKTASVKIAGSEIDTIRAAFGDSIKSVSLTVDKTKIKEAHTAGMGVAGTAVVRNPYLIIKG